MTAGIATTPLRDGFNPQLTRDEAVALAKEYRSEGDEAAFVAGDAIRNGDYSLQQLATIFKWKTNGRGKSRLMRNDALDVEDALRLACAARAPRSAIAVLVGLHGVAVPVASSIMTVIYPDRYTVIDFRALEALGRRNDDHSISFYVGYLNYCHELANAWNMTLRQLDRALWQWSRERSHPSSSDA